MRAGINCALANRQITHPSDPRRPSPRSFPQRRLPLLYDVSHNTCKVEEHTIDGQRNGVRPSQRRNARLRSGHPDLAARFATLASRS